MDLTVVIPTRERCDTLYWCLKTCVAQDYDRLSIVVSDNASQDQTREVVESFKDPRIRYLRTPGRLSMSENWEFALSHLEGCPGYISFLGDDDGLLTGAVRHWSGVIAEHAEIQAFSWPLCYYTWPDVSIHSLPNMLRVSTDLQSRTVDCRQALAEMTRFERSYTDICRVYYGIVSAPLLLSLRRKGKLIHSRIPDVYLGTAVTTQCPAFLVHPFPLSIVGASRHSGGTFEVLGAGTRGRAGTDGLFAQEVNLPFHPKAAYAGSIRIVEFEAMLQAADVELLDLTAGISSENLFRGALNEARHRSRAKRADIRQALEKIAELNGWSEQFNGVAMEFTDLMIPPDPVVPSELPEPIATEHNLITLFAGSMGLDNVADAANAAAVLIKGPAFLNALKGISTSVTQEEHYSAKLDLEARVADLSQQAAIDRAQLAECQAQMEALDSLKARARHLHGETQKWRARAKAAEKEKKQLKAKVTDLRAERKEQAAKTLSRRVRNWWSHSLGR